MSKSTEDRFSCKNQDILGKFVGREVICNANQVIAQLYKASFETNCDYSEELQSVMFQDNWREPLKWFIESDADQDELIELLDDTDYDPADMESVLEWFNQAEASEIEDAARNFNLNPSMYEAYEHWIISDYLAGKLHENEEMVADIYGLTIWGRCTTGQAILLDSVIADIAEDMEIIVGQSNEWSTK